MAIIKISKISLKSFIPLLYGITENLKYIIKSQYNCYTLDYDILENSLIIIISYIFIVITRKKMDTNSIKKEQEKDLIKNNEINDLKNSMKINQEIYIKSKRKKMIIIIGILMSLSIIFQYLEQIKRTKGVGGPGSIVFFIGFMILNKFILKRPITRHSIFSTIAIIILVIIKKIIEAISNSSNPVESNIIFLLFYGFYFISLALSLNIGKIYMEKLFIDKFSIIFYIGIILLIIFIILEPFTFLIKCNYTKFCEDNKYYNIIKQIKFLYVHLGLKLIIFTFLSIIINFINQFLIWSTVIYFTPSHFCIGYVLYCFLVNIIKDLINNTEEFYKDYSYYIIYLLIIFFSLTFNEIIIITIFGLDKDTSIKVTERQKIEFVSLINTIELDDENTMIEHFNDTTRETFI